jgi:hypothetical protein
MKLITIQTKRLRKRITYLVGVVSFALLLPGNAMLFAKKPLPVMQDQAAAVTIPPEQLDSLVAPIALYPDNLLSQTLVAATYPLEVGKKPGSGKGPEEASRGSEEATVGSKYSGHGGAS